MTLRLARTSAEAYLYLGLTPCDVCGGTGFTPSAAPLLVDGELASQYAGRCGHCGVPREFRFRLPEQVVPFDEDDPRFGDDRPSELLDAGQWMLLADQIAAGLPDDRPADLSVDVRREMCSDLRSAAAALTEALKFIPAGADVVPEEALWSEYGRAAYAREPERFRRQRLEAVRQRLSGMAEGYRPADGAAVRDL